MTLFQQTQSADPILVRVSSNSATTIVDGTTSNPTGAASAFDVHTLYIQETANGTPNLTVDVWDGTTAFIVGDGVTSWTAKPVTAKQSIKITDIIVPAGSKLRVTSSAAGGGFDVIAMVSRKNSG